MGSGPKASAVSAWACFKAVMNLSPPLQLTSNRGEEIVVPKGLRKKSHMRRYQLHVHQLSGEAAHEDNRQGRVETGQGRRELAAVHHRHPQVCQHQTDILVKPMRKELERTSAIGSLQDGIPLILKHPADDTPQTLLILHHEHRVSSGGNDAFTSHADKARWIVEGRPWDCRCKGIGYPHHALECWRKMARDWPQKQ